jgi:cytochrome P450
LSNALKIIRLSETAMSSMGRLNNPAARRLMPELPFSALAHIPGTDGWPVIGNTLQLLADPKGVMERFGEQYGPVLRTRSFGGRVVTLLGPEANEFVLLDHGKLFSSEQGWERIFGRLFPRGLMLMDFDEHRLHRKALSIAFKAGALKSYLEKLNQGVAAGISSWLEASRDLPLYPAIKRMTLDLAADSFLGEGMGPDAERIKRAFIEMIAASVAVVRSPIPGTQMSRGVKARRIVIEYFGGQIAARRRSHAEDLFTQLCKATTEDGSLLTAQEISDHMSFLMMAAHDTLASSLSALVNFLALDPNWQERLRAEIQSLRLSPGEPLPFERLDDLPLTEMAFNETMRLIPPAPAIRRCALRDTEFAGFRIPRGTRVAINPLYTHHMPQLWPEPMTFDPLRFSGEAVRARHKYAFIPFGGGAHMCLGQRFAYIQAKCFAYHLLSRSTVSVNASGKPDWRYWPIPRPSEGFQARLTPL